MNKEKVKKALTELDVILNEAIPEEEINKISKKFLKFVKENKDTNWKFEYDETKEIENQNVLEETKLLLGLVYINYWANADEKKEINKILDENEKKYSDSFSINNMFKVDNEKIENEIKVKDTINNVENLPVQYKQGFIKKIIIFIKNKFKKGSKNEI